MDSVSINVTLKGPLFEKKIDDVVKRAILEEAFSENGSKYTKETIPQRIRRLKKRGHHLGRDVNTIDIRRSGLTMSAETSIAKPRDKKPGSRGKRKGSPRPNWMVKAKVNPRTKGTKWKASMMGTAGYGQGAIRQAAKNIMPAIAKRIVAELG